MVTYKFTNIVVSAIAVLFFVFQAVNTTESISYEDFLQCVEDAVTSEVANDNKDEQSLEVSKLPHEILDFMQQELYENRVLMNLETTTKDDLKKMLTNDLRSRKSHYENNKKIFESFILRTLDRDMKNYPDEKSGVNVMEITFLSLMTMTVVDKIIEDTIVDKKALDENWNVLTLKDAFRTVYFYCKYPKEMASFLTRQMRIEVKEWLDSTATWGIWDFDDDIDDSSNKKDNDTLLFKTEL